ncbi:helix-turn-helix domain-containing protein [Myroides phaeus]|uniref:helix-turn-helix domain-containing protein n=1 Tax=Myroides phaeus TaxID=702745 RepID=UPI002DBDBECE|nr:helix-turn-helix domain-containing protein [Myroides phaeus]MEC4115959.1 helix-turn-helix domain-containing protein [Myroides phaeus]
MPQNKVIKVQMFDKNIPIELYSIEDATELFNFDYHYQYNFYQIFWFTEVENSQQQIDFQSYPIKPQEIWIIYPGQVQFFNPTGIKGYYLAIDKDYFNRIIHHQLKENTFKLPPPLHFLVSEDKVSLFTSLLNLVALEWNGQKRTEVLERYLELSLIHIQDLERLSDAYSPKDTRVFQLLEMIEDNYTKERSNDFYAQKIALSVKRMNEILVNATNATLSQHLQYRLLLEAKRLIGYSDLNISEISADLGFSEVNYFNRFFKKNTGFTPIEFRTNVKKVQVELHLS